MRSTHTLSPFPSFLFLGKLNCSPDPSEITSTLSKASKTPISGKLSFEFGELPFLPRSIIPSTERVFLFLSLPCPEWPPGLLPPPLEFTPELPVEPTRPRISSLSTETRPLGKERCLKSRLSLMESLLEVRTGLLDNDSCSPSLVAC